MQTGHLAPKASHEAPVDKNSSIEYVKKAFK